MEITKSKSALKSKLDQINQSEKSTSSSVGMTSVNAVPDASKFVYIDGTLKALDLAFLTNENVILYGKGGHGKSEVVEWYLHNKDITPFVKTMGSGTTTDSLFGGVDIKKFNDTGMLEFLVENSFMNHEYVIFEELMDAPDYILEQLKDILTSKKFRNGGQTFNIKTKLIICCTNRTRDEFSKNDSLKALMERFPLEFKVEWDSYNRTTYGFMFQTMFGKNYKTLEYILEKLAQADNIVSPRTAVKAARILDANKGDYDALQFIADFAGKNAKMVKEEVNKYKVVEQVESVIETVKGWIKEVDGIQLNNLDNIKKMKNLLRSIDAETKALKSKKADDELTKTIMSNVSQFEKYLVDKADAIQKATEA